MAAGNNVDNVVKNALSVYVILQIDDAVKMAFNSLSCVKTKDQDKMFLLKYYKMMYVDPNRGKVGERQSRRWWYKGLFGIFFVCPTFVCLITWIIAHNSKEFDC